ncbi:DegT/DnrJ/EryC1/StrS family aminotransferase [Pontibacter anaerobius]|uniref:DegT/DnrJ/EryC1/StrS family aminotransferase n=1 Tax=Pontibacter anaerobius TaxID=2993940 RepID=A0ABT3RBW5_9BACT|nr:DegT/DnrJ/EryC1/StrS family aminotransferase [Pontibacter anaerobius]MCX2738775.1 DegT/DnrJ/EryC1/StrS family aminotransferase [Pontibacter anaerobius]
MQPLPYFQFRDFPAGLEAQVQQALLEAVAGKQYVLGPQVQAFEQEFATYLGAGAAVGVGNGYDALVIALKALGVGAGDEVVLPVHTFIATVNAVLQVGAKPVLAEPDKHTYNLTAETAARHINPKTKAILAVHLYGQVCQMEGLQGLAQSQSIKLLEDAAQAHGAKYKGQQAGSFGDAAAFSFYPTKNLGALGDAGAVVTSDADVKAFARKYRNYGESQKYTSEQVGINSRLDELHAAVLRVKLQLLDAMNAERQRLAQVYLQALQNTGDLILPQTAPDCEHVYHIFNIRTKYRNELQAYLQEQGIGTAIHYPVPVHLQPAYTFLGYKAGDFPVAEELASTSLSLPLYPGLTEPEQQRVVEKVKAFFSKV